MTEQHVGAKPWRADGFGEHLHLSAELHTRLDAGALAAGACRALIGRPADAMVLMAAAAARPKLNIPFACIDAIIGRSATAPVAQNPPEPPWRGIWAPAAVPIYALMQSASLIGAGLKALVLAGASLVALAAVAFTACRKGPLQAFEQMQYGTAAALAQSQLQHLELPELGGALTGLIQAWQSRDSAQPGPDGLNSMSKWALDALPALLAAMKSGAPNLDPSAALELLLAQLNLMPDVVNGLNLAMSTFGAGASASQLLDVAQRVLLPVLQQIPWDTLANTLTNEEVLKQALTAFERLSNTIDWGTLIHSLADLDLSDMAGLPKNFDQIWEFGDRFNWPKGFTDALTAMGSSIRECLLAALDEGHDTVAEAGFIPQMLPQSTEKIPTSPRQEKA